MDGAEVGGVEVALGIHRGAAAAAVAGVGEGWEVLVFQPPERIHRVERNHVDIAVVGAAGVVDGDI